MLRMLRNSLILGRKRIDIKADMKIIKESKWSEVDDNDRFYNSEITVSYNGFQYLLRIYHEYWTWEMEFGLKSRFGCVDVDYEIIDIEDALHEIYEEGAVNVARKLALRYVEQFFEENPDYVPKKGRIFNYILKHPVTPVGYYNQEVAITDITFPDKDRIRISLQDGRVLESPLTLFPAIRDLSEEERKDWKPIGSSGFQFKSSPERYNVEEFLGHYWSMDDKRYKP